MNKILPCILFLLGPLAFGQFVTITGVVSDPNGVPYAGSSGSVPLAPRNQKWLINNTNPVRSPISLTTSQDISSTIRSQSASLPGSAPSSPSSTNSGIVNGVYSPAQCGQTPAPQWCSGSDIGAWVNAAASHLPNGCGEIDISAGRYSQTTTILVPRCVKLRGQSAYGTTLTVSGGIWSIIVADGLGAGNYPEGAVEDLTILCASRSNYGIYYGGSTGVSPAPSTSIDASTNYGDHTNLNRVRVGDNSSGCGVGVQIGNNVWMHSLHETLLDGNVTNYSIPAGLDNSGESMSVLSCSIQNASGVGIAIGNNSALNVALTNTKIDYNRSWGIQNGTSRPNTNVVTMTGGSIEQYGSFAQNYGTLVFTGVAFVDGTQSGVRGYLFDNESGATGNSMTFIGGWLHNGGAGLNFNPSGTGVIAIGLASSKAINNILTSLPVSSGFITIGGGMLGNSLSWPSGIGAINHIVGPSDQSLSITNQNNQNINIGANGTGVVFIASPLYQTSVMFTDLPTSARNGESIYCSNCTVTTPSSCQNSSDASACTCTSGGNGAFAKRINGAWLCQ